MSIAFKWDITHFHDLLKSCDFDPVTPYILKYMPSSGKILEAGCGLARYVAYLSERGFDVIGIELSQDTVDAVKSVAREMDVKQGDVAKMAFEDNSVSGIISLGVVEHFIQGPKEPLTEMFRVLRPGCYLVITVPSFNHLRRSEEKLGLGVMLYGNWIRILKRCNTIRRIFGKKPITGPSAQLPYRQRSRAVSGSFFEFFFTKQEFEKELEQVGFRIVESVPVQLLDGIFHEFGPGFVKYDGVPLLLNIIGKLLNSTFGLIPYFHNICISV